LHLQFLLVGLVLALNLLVLHVDLVDALVLVDEEGVRGPAQKEGFMLGEVGTVGVVVLAEVSEEQREADELVVEGEVELLLFGVVVPVLQEIELDLSLDGYFF
jgi:hypothetical protein